VVTPLLSEGRGRLLAGLCGIALLQAGALVASVLLVRHVFDDFVVVGAGLEGITLPVILLAVVALLASVLRYAERVQAERLGQAYVHAVRTQMVRHLNRVSVRAFQMRSRGGVLLKFVNDLTALRQWVSYGVARLGSALIVYAVTTLGLVMLSWRLALIVATMTAVPALLAAWTGKPLEASVRVSRRRRGRLSTDLNERVAAVAVVQAHGQTNREAKRVERRSRALVQAMVRRARWVGVLRALTELGIRGSSLGVLVLGAVEVSAGRLSPGAVVGALTIIGFLVAPLRDLGRVFEYWQSAKVAWEKVGDFLALPQLVTQAREAAPLRRGGGALRFRRVSVHPGLSGIDARVLGGTRLLVRGPNGSGKSTLLWLAARLIDPDEGVVSIDGQDVRGVTLKSLRRAVGIVSPDLPLLRGTVRRNLTYRKPAASAARIDEIVDRCGLADLIDQLPQGMDTRLVDEGRNLSVGQRQRVALGRALLGRPPLLLLDDADAGVDEATRELLRAVVSDHRGTVVIATQLPGWSRTVDEVWHLDGGRLTTPDAAPVLNLGTVS
jgi:ABC-type multidrug transport system fused ATPase/permease subunit